MASDVPGLDHEFDNERRRSLVLAEVALRKSDRGGTRQDAAARSAADKLHENSLTVVWPMRRATTT
jgi:hypothetical protein